MQALFKIFLLFVLSACLAGCNDTSQEANEKAIRSIVRFQEDSYNQQNSSKLFSHWAPDATYFNPLTGEFVRGKEAIEALFKEKFDQGNVRHLEIMIKSIEFPVIDEAIERGVMKIKIDDNPTLNMAYQAVYIKENGEWLVKAINLIEIQKVFSNYEHLKDLEWLIGKWKDFDENMDIFFDIQWDKNKNFITQQFMMKIYAQDVIEGRQIIAWDPEKKTVRSWVFDSDGGFGEGTWVKVGNSWYATMRFTLADGRPASSVNVYTPIDGRSYKFASIERDVNGEILPDINAFTVERIE